MRTPKREDFTYVHEDRQRRNRPWIVLQVFVWFVDRIVGTVSNEKDKNDMPYQYKDKYRRN
jgi:hypothetical protein